MMISNDWMSEDCLSIYDMIDMLEKFQKEYEKLELMHDRELKKIKQQSAYKVEMLTETILQLQDEIRILKGEAQ